MCGYINKAPSWFPDFSFCYSPSLSTVGNHCSSKSKKAQIFIQNYTVLYTYPDYILSVDICSFLNKVYHYIPVAMKSSHMQGSALIERRKLKK